MNVTSTKRRILSIGNVGVGSAKIPDDDRSYCVLLSKKTGRRHLISSLPVRPITWLTRAPMPMALIGSNPTALTRNLVQMND